MELDLNIKLYRGKMQTRLIVFFMEMHTAEREMKTSFYAKRIEQVRSMFVHTHMFPVFEDMLIYVTNISYDFEAKRTRVDYDMITYDRPMFSSSVYMID